MAVHSYCDGIRRRDLLKVGLLGGLGFSLADYVRLAEGGQIDTRRASSAIFVNLGGGPSHMDTFDLKPSADSDKRGAFNPIATNCSGVEISEHLPLLAQCADKYTILRGVSHSLAAHELGSKYLNTGNRPVPSIEYPGYGAVVAKELGSAPDLPPFIAIPSTTQTSGYLGVEFAPMQTNAVPRPGTPFNVRGVSLSGGVTIEDVNRRQKLLSSLDRTFEGLEKSSDLIEGLDRFSEQALNIISSKRAREAFDVSKEEPSIAKEFGQGGFGQSCLLASRLIESGVRFVTVTMGGYDTHRDNFNRLKTNLLPELDRGLSTLFRSLELKGLLGETAIVVTGEFGRTPKINGNSGRDHWPRAMFVLMAGGGVQGGRVLGASDLNGMGPLNTAISPDDVAASFFHNLGIDHTKEFHTTTGRPVMVVRNGNVIPELFS